MALQVGTRLGPYEVLGPVGAGGMGEVYRARDTRLGRDVAIKVLPPRFADDHDRLRRFEQEARAVAALNHPNILSLHDVGTYEGAPYLVTELLDGESLRDRLKGRVLPVREVVEISVQMARGLAAAHEKGIIHRDLKPENVFVAPDGRVKILDFGIAKLAPPRSAEEQAWASTVLEATEAGTVLGTGGYMSPEQVRGQTVDHRTDVFSFGCVLYEMLSGSRAFTGATAADTVSAILSRDPPPLSGPGRDVPAALEGVANRCLKKRPEDRFSSAHDLALALELSLDVARTPAPSAAVAGGGRRWTLGRRLAIGAVAAAVLFGAAGAVWWWRGGGSAKASRLNPRRVMVMPFENVTGDRSLDPLGRLAADWISQGLLQIEHIEVVSGSVGAEPAAGAVPAGDAARARANGNRAGTVIVGAYYPNGTDLEMHGRLIETGGGKVLYAAEPARCPRIAPMECVDRVRQRLMGAVVTQFDLPEYTVVIQKPPLYEAYKEYMVGLEAHGIDLPKALAHFERAVQLDPDFMIAQIRLASAYCNVKEWVKAEALFTNLRASAERMTLAERLFLDLIDAMYHGRLVETYQAAKKLHALVPVDSIITWQVAENALLTGRPREALAVLGDITPLLAQSGRLRQISWWVTTATRAHHFLGEHEAELVVARKGLETFPDMLSMHAAVAQALAALGRVDELDQALDAALAVPSGRLNPGYVLVVAADELRVHGHPEASPRLARRAVDWYRGQPPAQLEEESVALGLVRALCAAGLWDDARSAASRVAGAVPGSIGARGYLGLSAAHMGDRVEARKMLQWLETAEDLDDRGSPTLWRARITAQMGEKEQAIVLLREAFRQGQSLIVRTHADRELDPLRAETAFQDLVKPKG